MITSSVIDSATRAATYSQAPQDIGADRFDYLLVTLDIQSAERDTANETYDFYVTTENAAGARWDVVHFPQIATTGAKRYLAKVVNGILPGNVTTAAPGVLAQESATLAVIAGGTNATKSLAAGIVRHGPWGNKFGLELVIAGTVATGIAYTLTVEGRVR